MEEKVIEYRYASLRSYTGGLPTPQQLEELGFTYTTGHTFWHDLLLYRKEIHAA